MKLSASCGAMGIGIGRLTELQHGDPNITQGSGYAFLETAQELKIFGPRRETEATSYMPQFWETDQRICAKYRQATRFDIPWK